MKKATISQHSYIATGILTAIIQRSGTITDDDIRMAVTTAQKTLAAIIEAVGDIEDEHEYRPPRKKKPEEPVTDIFAGYPWTASRQASYTELTTWLRQEKGITSGRAIDKTMHTALDNGFLVKGEIRGQYIRPIPIDS